MLKRIVAALLLSSFMFWGAVAVSYGGSAEVLPKGVTAVNVKYSGYLKIDKQFDEDGNKEELAEDFNANLNSSVFPALQAIEIGYGLPPGSASIGESVVDFDYYFHDLILNLQYGLFDTVSVGIKIPYYFNKNDVDAELDTTNATVGINPGAPGGIAPLTIPGTRPFTTNDVQQLLGGGLDTDGDGIVDIPGYGFKKFKSWDDSGLSDIEFGFKWQYLRTENFRLAFTGGARAPTGEQDDPDNLTDIGFGSGAWAILFKLHNDYTGVKDLVLNFTFEYDWVLSDKQELRVPEDKDQPITANKERVDRDQGDIFRLGVSGDYNFAEAWSFGLLYEYKFALKDKISGDKGYNYDSLEEDSDWTSHLFSPSISYSTIPAFRAKKFPIPATVAFEYEYVFAGTNGTLVQHVFTLSLTAFF